MRVIYHNWSATKQRLHPQSVAEISHHSVLSGGQDSTMWDIIWVSPQGHRSVSVSRHFLLQAPQCPCSVQKRFSRDHCCRGRSTHGKNRLTTYIAKWLKTAHLMLEKLSPWTYSLPWNSLQAETRNAATLESFKKKLKTLFYKHFGDWLSFLHFICT